MNIIPSLKRHTESLIQQFSPPPVRSITFPLLMSGGGADCRFMALQLEDGSTGLSYIDIPQTRSGFSSSEASRDYQTRSLEDLVDGFGSAGQVDPFSNIIGMAAINAISRHCMKRLKMEPLDTNDPYAGLRIGRGDILGMVGFFKPIAHQVLQKGSRLVVVEKRKESPEHHEGIQYTTDPNALQQCNKVFITATTILNGSIDSVLEHCSSADQVAVAGPTLGFFPDVLFEHGVTSVGGRYVARGDELVLRLLRGERWGDAAKKVIFLKSEYSSQQLIPGEN